MLTDDTDRVWSLKSKATADFAESADTAYFSKNKIKGKSRRGFARILTDKALSKHQKPPRMHTDDTEDRRSLFAIRFSPEKTRAASDLHEFSRIRIESEKKSYQ